MASITTPPPGGGGLVRAKFGIAKFGVVKIWYEILNMMEKCGTKFPDCAHPEKYPGTSSVEAWYFYNSATCFLCYSPVKQGSKLEHENLKNFFFSSNACLMSQGHKFCTLLSSPMLVPGT